MAVNIQLNRICTPIGRAFSGNYLLNCLNAIRRRKRVITKDFPRLHEPAARPNLLPPDEKRNRGSGQYRRNNGQNRTGDRKPERRVHALRGQGQQPDKCVLAQHNGADGAARVHGVGVDDIMANSDNDGRRARADHDEADDGRAPGDVGERRPRVHEHAAGDADEAAQHGRVQPGLGDGRAGRLGVAPGRAVVPVVRGQAEEPAEDLADDEGGLDVAGADGVPAVQAGEDELDRLREEVDDAEAEGGPQRHDDEDGLVEEHVQRPLDAALDDLEHGRALQLVSGVGVFSVLAQFPCALFQNHRPA